MASNDTDLATQYADNLRESIVTAMEAVQRGAEIEEQDAVEYLDEWPLEIVNRRGARFAVVLTVGGPYAAVEADLDEDGDRSGSARLVVSWGSGEVARFGSHINDLLDYFAERVKM